MADNALISVSSERVQRSLRTDGCGAVVRWCGTNTNYNNTYIYIILVIVDMALDLDTLTVVRRELLAPSLGELAQGE